MAIAEIKKLAMNTAALNPLNLALEDVDRKVLADRAEARRKAVAEGRVKALVGVFSKGESLP